MGTHTAPTLPDWTALDCGNKPGTADAPRTLEDVARDVCAALPGGRLVRGPGATGRAVFSVEAQTDLGRLADEVSRRADVDWAETDSIDRAQ